MRHPTPVHARTRSTRIPDHIDLGTLGVGAGFPIASIAEDYLNAAYWIRFIEARIGTSGLSGYLQSLREIGIPDFAEYYCMKAVGGGFAASSEAITAWRALTPEEREAFREKIESRFSEPDVFGPACRPFFRTVRDLSERLDFLLSELPEPDRDGNVSETFSDVYVRMVELVTDIGATVTAFAQTLRFERKISEILDRETVE